MKDHTNKHKIVTVKERYKQELITVESAVEVKRELSRGSGNGDGLFASSVNGRRWWWPARLLLTERDHVQMP